MDAQPKTRQESKGRDKKGGKHIYSQKHVRAAEALREKRVAAGAPQGAKGKN